ncbi:MAG TPA: hypothetical protein VFT95_19995 [Micromonosporaceae bacterium]|nr:hypothetical protein [Micromonosporaceae bacterium]
MPSLRRYRTRIRLTFLGGTLPPDSYQALADAVRGAAPGDVSCAVSTDAYDAFVVTAAVRAANPLDALTGTDAALTRALLSTGLFEEFDVSGRVLYSGPAELVGGE